MARPTKQGLDYFPLDVDFFQDLKIRKIIRVYGDSATSILICILCMIYKDNGYYIKWDEDTVFIISEILNSDEEKISLVVSKAIEIDFFNKEVFLKFSILTSRAIQKRFQLIIKNSKLKRSKIEDNLNLLGVNTEEMGKSSEETPINSEETPINSEESTQSKGKKSKVNNTPYPFKGEIQVSENSEEEKKDDLIKTPEEKKEEKSSAKKEELIFNFPLKDNAFFSDEEFYNLPSFIQQSKDMLLEWGEYKKQAKKTYTKMGAIKLFSRINNFFNNNTQRLQAAIDFSMASNYQGIYEGHNTRQNGNIRHQEVTKLPDPDEYGEGTL